MVATREHDTKIDDCLVPAGCSLGFCLLTLRNQLNQVVNFSNDFGSATKALQTTHS